MNLKDINCKCPECGMTFALGDALEEQAVEQVRAELAALNDEDVKVRIETEAARALNEGKKLGSQENLKRVTIKQKELDDANEKLMTLKILQVEMDSEFKRLKHQQDAAVTLKVAERKSEWDAQKNASDNAFKLEIQQLRDDVKRAHERASQGSMQAQGEVSELVIEDMLRSMFPTDEVIEVKKGQRGADCILIVKNKLGRPVGKVLFESKDTKSFASEWVQKLKADAIKESAQISVLVTSAWPSDNSKTHMREGVWVCGFNDYPTLVRALRQSLLDISKVTASEQAREGKAQIMYDFLTSQEFANTIEQIISPILRMHEQLEKEERAIRKLWKERKTLIEGSTSGIETLYMKMQGIAQVNLPAVAGLDAIEDLTREL